MHTVIVIGMGFALLLVCLATGRWIGGDMAGVAAAAIIFIPVWLVGALINMWIGVTRAGYSVTEELPTLVLVFAVPAVAAAIVAWYAAH
jgi:hypothetical protein